MVKRRVAFRRKRQNRLAMFLVTTVVLMLLLVVGTKSVELKAKQRVYEAREQVLLEQIAEEETRTEENEEFRKSTTTKKYDEEVAKDKLGLVYAGEILFKEEQ